MRRWIGKSDVKSSGSTGEGHLILLVLSFAGVGRIPSVEVKFVEIGRNTGGESGSLSEH